MGKYELRATPHLLSDFQSAIKLHFEISKASDNAAGKRLTVSYTTGRVKYNILQNLMMRLQDEIAVK